MIVEYVTDSTEAIAAAAASGVMNVWIHGSKTFVTSEPVTEEKKKSVPVSKKIKPVPTPVE